MKITFEYWLKKYCMLLEIVKGETICLSEYYPNWEASLIEV